MLHDAAGAHVEPGLRVSIHRIRIIVVIFHNGDVLHKFFYLINDDFKCRLFIKVAATLVSKQVSGMIRSAYRFHGLVERARMSLDVAKHLGRCWQANCMAAIARWASAASASRSWPQASP